MNKIFFFLIGFLFLFSSCANTRYISKKNVIPKTIIDLYTTKDVKYTIQPYDYLYVNIKTTNEEINKLYSQISSQMSTSGGVNESSFFLTGYLVNDSGYVFIPTIGNVMVKGLTIDEARLLIQNKINEILNDAITNVRLTSFNVTFLGEVMSSGKIPFYKEKVNILEAIGKSGGVTSYGDLKHIKVIRSVDSVMQVYNLDITNSNILEQKEFFLFPNDIIYVPPKRSKDMIKFFSDYSTVVTVLTSTVTTTLLIIQLYKNK